MRITEVVVSSDRVIPHPHESYANPAISLKAALEEGDDLTSVVETLRDRCESYLNEHVAHIKASLKPPRRYEDDEGDEDDDLDSHQEEYP
jgi:hypothetical protein